MQLINNYPDMAAIGYIQLDSKRSFIDFVLQISPESDGATA